MFSKDIKKGKFFITINEKVLPRREPLIDAGRVELVLAGQNTQLVANEVLF